jgi:hypothetical protein
MVLVLLVLVVLVLVLYVWTQLQLRRLLRAPLLAGFLWLVLLWVLLPERVLEWAS